MRYSLPCITAHCSHGLNYTYWLGVRLILNLMISRTCSSWKTNIRASPLFVITRCCHGDTLTFLSSLMPFRRPTCVKALFANCQRSTLNVVWVWMRLGVQLSSYWSVQFFGTKIQLLVFFAVLLHWKSGCHQGKFYLPACFAQKRHCVNQGRLYR